MYNRAIRSTLLLAAAFLYAAVGVGDAVARQADPSSWTMTIFASAGETNDLITQFGVNPAASNGFESNFDTVEPPAPPTPAYIRAYFRRPEWGLSIGSSMNRDIQAPLSDPEVRLWPLDVQASGLTSQTLTLSWTAPSIESHLFFLIDQATGAEVNMDQATSYDYPANTSTRGFTILVLRGAAAPTATNDSATTDEDIAVVIDVLANDTDIDGTLEAATVTIVNQPAGGTLSVNSATGAVTYAPEANFNGSDSFTYTVRDNEGATSNEAVVSLSVGAVNDAPTATDDAATTAEDTTVVMDVLANDADLDGILEASTVTIVHQPAGGTLSVTPVTGAVTYTPDANVNGSDSFTYTVQDDEGATSNEAVATVTIQAVNDAPTATDDAATTAEDTAVLIDVLANDADLDGTLVAVTIVDQPAGGTLSLDSATGTVTYTPDANVNGTDSFTYTVQDNEGATSNEAVVTVGIGAVNDAPTATDDSATTAEDTAVLIDVLANDVDLEGTLEAATVTLVKQPAGGTISVNPATGAVTYTPDANVNGSDAFSYTVQDNEGATSNEAVATVSIQAVNDAPTATDDAATTAEDTAVVIDVLTNDTDLDGTLVTSVVTIVNQPVRGTLSVNPATGAVTYTPDANVNGSDSFTYTVQDDEGATSNEAVVTVTIQAVNDAPKVVASFPAALITLQSVPFSVFLGNLEGTFSDQEGDPISFEVQTSDSALLKPVIGSEAPFPLTLQFSSLLVGQADVTVTATDGLATGSFTSKVTVRTPGMDNRVPRLVPVPPQQVDAGSVVSFSIEATDDDALSLAVQVPGLDSAAYTFVDSGNGTGTFEWPTTVSDEGAFTASFTASDGLTTSLLNVTLNVVASTDIEAPSLLFVTPPGDAMLATARPVIVVEVADNQASASELVIVFKVDNRTERSFSLTQGSLSYTPEMDLADGMHTAFVRATDPSGNTVTAALHFTIKTQVLPIVLDAVPAQTRAERIDLSGRAEGKLDLRVSRDGQVLAEVTADGDGLFRFEDIGMIEADNTFDIDGYDTLGNAASSVAVQISRDRTPPGITIQSPLAHQRTSTPELTAEIVDTGAGIDPSSLLIWVDGVAFSSFDQEGTAVWGRLPVLAEGDHRVVVAVADLLGNQTPPVVVDFQVDTRVPTAVHPFLDETEIEEIHNDTPLISIPVSDPIPGSGINPASLVFRIDGVIRNHTFIRENGEVRYDAEASNDTLADGPHTLSLELADWAGNAASVQGGMAISTGVVDTTSPYFENLTPAPGSTSGGVGSGSDAGKGGAAAVSFIFSDIDSGPDFASSKVTINGTVVTGAALRVNEKTGEVTAGGQRALSSIIEGRNEVSISGRDRLGNESALGWSFFVDSTPPEPPVLSTAVVSGFTSLAAIPVSIAVAGDTDAGSSQVTARVLVNGIPVAQVAGELHSQVSIDQIPLTDGANAIQADVLDLAGNISPVSEPKTVYLDVTGPVISDFRPAGGTLLNTTLPRLQGRVSDDLSGLDTTSFGLLLDGDSVRMSYEYDETAGTIVLHVLDSLANGDHVALFTASDRVGNTGLALAPFTVRTGPLAVPANLTMQRVTSELLLSLSGDKAAGTGVEIVLQDSLVATIPVNEKGEFAYQNNLSTLGASTTVQVRLFDPAGSRSPLVTVGTLLSDSKAPSFSESMPSPGVANMDDLVVSALVSDDQTGVDPGSIRLTIQGKPLQNITVIEEPGGYRVQFSDNDFFNQFDSGALLQVTLEASDLSEPANHSVVRWQFTGVANQTPVWSSPQPRIIAAEDESVLVDLSLFLSDPDDQLDDLRVSVITGNSQIHAATSALITTVEPSQDFNGFDIPLEITAIDPQGASVTDTLWLDINPVNDSPRFVSVLTDTLVVLPEESVSIQLEARDPDVVTNQDVIQFSLRTNLASARIDSVSGRFSFVAQASDAGIHRVFFEVTDQTGASDSLSLVVQIPVGTTRVDPGDHLPIAFALRANYPNPFQNSTTIPVEIPESSSVTLSVYDMLGRHAALLVSKHLSPGVHRVVWRSETFAAGVYLYHLQADGFQATRTMLLVR